MRGESQTGSALRAGAQRTKDPEGAYSPMTQTKRGGVTGARGAEWVRWETKEKEYSYFMKWLHTKNGG